MALPIIATPEFHTEIPSTKEPIKFRPFLVKEEKVLYMALESGDNKDIFNATQTILDNCILTPGIELDKFTTYDIEYLFLQLRAKSVGEVLEVNVRHPDEDYECKAVTKVSINIDDIKIQFDENHNDKIDLGTGVGIQMMDPKASSVLKIRQDANQLEQMLDVVYSSVKLVYDQDDVYEDFTKEEFGTFMEGLTKEQFTLLTDWFETAPKLLHEISFVCEECGKPETIKLEGLQSFFT